MLRRVARVACKVRARSVCRRVLSRVRAVEAVRADVLDRLLRARVECVLIGDLIRVDELAALVTPAPLRVLHLLDVELERLRVLLDLNLLDRLDLGMAPLIITCGVVGEGREGRGER